MTEQKKLKELANAVRIVGTLKEINLEIKPNKKDPSVTQIMGDLVVLVKDKQNNRINEHKVKLFAKDSGKLFKGYKTIKETYRSIDQDGAEYADRISVTGSISGNDFMNQAGELISTNDIRGLFINRVDEQALSKDPSLAEDSAVAQIELVVNGIRPLTDREGVETGEYRIDGFTVGYNNGVTVLRNIVVGEDLADVINDNYSQNSTGKLTFAINHYVEVQEKPQSSLAEAGGFGVQVDIEGTVEKHVRELRVIGGFPPYYDERALEESDIQLAKQIRELRLQEIKNSVPSTPVQTGQGGFGANAQPGFGATPTNADPFANAGAIDISDEDLPF
jgi:hypothetical protein